MPTLSQQPLRLAAVAAGPVFYQVPLYRLLAADPQVDLTVYYSSSGGVRPYDAALGGRQVVWDLDLSSGYRLEFLSRADTGDVLKGFFALRDFEIVRKLREGRFDAVWVHGYSYLTNWLAFLAAAVVGIPVLLREEQTLLHPRRPPKSWLRELVLRSLFRSVYGLYIGSANRAYFERYGVSADRLFFTPYAVDNDSLREQAALLRPQAREIRASYGIAPDLPVILFVGKLISKKDPLVLLRAFAELRRQNRCALLFVGEGELEVELRQYAAAAGLQDVHFATFHNRSEIPRAYAAADVFVLPSAYHETWGLVVNEAMNFGLPVVVSDKVGAGCDLVTAGENGAVFPAGHVAALATALAPLIESRALRAALGERSADRIATWTYERARDGIVDACLAAASHDLRRREAGARLAEPR